MAGASRLIVGLGNPGLEYEETRHNIGFVVADAIAKETETDWKKAPQPAMTALGRYKGRTFGIIKPLTFMNRAGDAVAPIARHLKVKPSEILVIYDDIHLDTGMIRLRQGGSAGGHNGVQNIIDRLGTNAFPRLRIGVGSNFSKGKQSEYVLSGFDKKEDPVIEEAVQKAIEAALTYLHSGIQTAMNRHNKRN